MQVVLVNLKNLLCFSRYGTCYSPVITTTLAVVSMVTLMFFAAAAGAASTRSLSIPILYLEQVLQQAPAISNIHPPPADSGLKGAELGVSDSNTTGRFLNHQYRLTRFVSDQPGEIIDQAHNWTLEGNALIIANLPAGTLLQLAGHPPLRHRILLFNAGSQQDSLRAEHCRTGLLHTLPSRAMLSDALAQFLIRKRWKRWFLVQGRRPEDLLFSSALQRSAKRFGGKIVATRTWSFDTDLRRVAQLEIPAFTQVDDYQVTLVADESGDVGEYIHYNTWLPRPVAGTQGLTPVAWHRVVEQWGAAQLQNRFHNHARRRMNSKDYGAWLAVRAIAEAVTRTGTTAPAELYNYLLGEEFQLAAFKGRKLSFRRWNGQLRQPIPLVHPRALVSQSPQEGFLHPQTDLDTLGFDKAEVHCDFNSTFSAGGDDA